jgi:hypothetical protein
MPNGPQFINFRMFNSSTPPSSPNYSGQIYYNTSTNLSYVYNGTTWIQTSGCLPLSGGTLTGEFIINVNGAASTPGEYINGTWYTGGTATTTKPQLLVEPSGTTSTGWSTSGTGIGVNAASGFDGNMLDLQVNGTSLVSVNDQGVIAMNPSTRGCITIYSSSTIPQINLGDIASKCVAFYWASDVGYITTSSYSYPLSLGASQINLVGGGIQSLAATSTGSIVIGPGSALAISATDGFLYIPACAGAPTGTPTANAGTVPIVFDTTNSKIWIFNGSWKGVAVS